MFCTNCNHAVGVHDALGRCHENDCGCSWLELPEPRESETARGWRR